MFRIVLLDSHPADQGDDVWGGLRSLGELQVFPRTTPAEVLERARDAEAVLTNKVVLDAGVLGALPGLRYIGVTATGTNVVDLDVARARGIAVTNVPGYSTASVVEMVFAMVLHFTMRAAQHDAAVKQGRWATSPDFSFLVAPTHELHGRTMAVVGRGAIGIAVSRVAEAFGMRVLPVAVPGSPTAAADRVPLETALPCADVVSLHCPLTEATRGMVDRRFLELLKPDAILINTGRGPLLVETDLMAALAAGRLLGVGLDVLTREPPATGLALLDPGAPWADRVLVTPHIAWATVEARRRLVDVSVANLASFLAGGSAHRVV